MSYFWRSENDDRDVDLSPENFATLQSIEDMDEVAEEIIKELMCDREIDVDETVEIEIFDENGNLVKTIEVYYEIEYQWA